MADIKIDELDPLLSQADTDLYEVSDDGNGSYKETRLQQKNYYADIFTSGPGSSTNNGIARYDGTTGKIIKDSGVTIDDSKNVTTSTGSYNAPLGGFYGYESIVTQMFSTSAEITNPSFGNKTSSQRYVSNGGSDDPATGVGGGQIQLPWATIQYAIAQSNPGAQVNAAPGSYSDTSFSMYPHKVLQGNGKYTTLYTVSGACSTQSSVWNISTSPAFEIRDIQLQAGSIDFTPSSKISNSRQSFINVQSVGEVLTTGNLTTVQFDGCEFDSIALTDVNNVVVKNTTLTNTTTPFTITNNTITTTVNVYFENVDFSGGDIYTTLTDFNCAPFNVTLKNCRNLRNCLDDDQGFVIVSTFNIDFVSYPNSGIYPVNGTMPTVISLDKLQWFDGRNQIGGAQLQFYDGTYNPFFWTGAGGSNPYIFAAGEGVHFNPGKHHNILLGNWSTSNFNGCFVWADGATTELANHFPSANNQFVIWPSGGFGVSVSNNTVRAGFHYGHAYGNDGKLLLSAAGAVSDGSMAASETNPQVVNNDYVVKLKNSSGTSYTYNLTNANAAPQSYSGTTVNLSATDLLSGATVFTGGSAQNANLPTAAALDAAIGAVPVGYSFFWVVSNQAATDLTITQGTNFAPTGMSRYSVGVGTVLAGEGKCLRVVKTASTPTYAIFG